ncbi:MAG: response regulator transcription factor [Bacteroidia bacterium]|nr:response regulator transcription factor [Bacteroidia bacterium]
MKRILIIEDEESIRKLLKLNLELEGYEVVTTDNGKTGIDLTEEQHFDVIILDVMLPEIDGFDVCEQIRLKNMEVPILFLTAKDSASDRVMGLKKGGDDYLTKPFNLEELLLRVQNLLKRSQGKVSKEMVTYTFGDNEVNFKTFDAIGVNGPFVMTKKEAMLLKLFIDRKNEVVSRQQIMQSVWGYDIYPTTRTIDNFILAFRKHFEKNPRNPQFFHSIRGIGYKFSEFSNG